MTTPATPSNSKPTGDDRNLVAVDATNAVSFEEKLHVFWQKNRSRVIGVCVLVLVAILAKGGWEYLAKQRELDVQKAYAAAATPEQLKAFIAAHPEHSLAGIAHLRMADEAYAAGKSAEAAASYDKAIGILKEGPLVARAQLGRALTKAQSGQAAEAANDFKRLADDATQFKAVRTEAVYHLASLAAEAGNAADLQKHAAQLLQIDPESPWNMRVMALQANLPPPAPAPSAIGVPGLPAGGEAKKDDATPSLQVKIPGK